MWSNMLISTEDGKKTTLDVSSKKSSVIFEELMDVGGGERWKRFKEEMAAGRSAESDAAQTPGIPFGLALCNFNTHWSTTAATS